MNKISNIMRAGLMVLLALALTIPVGAIDVVSAIDNDAIVINPEARVVDGVTLSNTAKSVDGVANVWDITLKVEASEAWVDSDTVIVIDKSGSMLDGEGQSNKMLRAKEAAKTLAKRLLEDSNTINRVAVVSFASKVNVDSDFTGDYDEVASKINGLKAKADTGTFTQAGINTAAQLLESSTANNRNMVLLSDGAPTYNYAITNPSDYLIDGGPGLSEFEKQTSTEVPKSAFKYNGVAGSGRSVLGLYESVVVGTAIGTGGRPYNILEYHYYNSGNCAIAEAGFFKESGIGDLYTVALDGGETGEEILEKIASAGKAYSTPSVDKLDVIFSQIAGNILSEIQVKNVVSEMGQGIKIASDSEYGVAGASSLEWSPSLKYDRGLGKYADEVTYRVEANSNILDSLDEEGYAPLNTNVSLNNTGNRGASFLTPKVKPTVINISKELEGQTCAGCRFWMELNHPDGEVTRYDVKVNETKHVVERFEEGQYSLTETGNASINAVRFESYIIYYANREFTIGRDHAKPINVTVKNVYETVDIMARKYWDDDNDKDGLRDDYTLYIAIKDGWKYLEYHELKNETYETIYFKDLPKYRNGEEIVYTIVESTDCTASKAGRHCSKFDGDDKYVVQTNGDYIVNKRIPEAKGLVELVSIVENTSLFNDSKKEITIKAPETGEITNITEEKRANADVGTTVAVLGICTLITMGGVVGFSKRKRKTKCGK